MSKAESIAKLFALLAVFAVGLFLLDGVLKGDWELRLLAVGGGLFAVSVFIVYVESVWRSYREKR
jgi:hypothetical protein